MKPYKILLNQKNNIRKRKVIPPIKKIKIPLFFCKYINNLEKREIIF
jgi:hypothetical protein